MSLPIYLDHHATTPVDPRVAEAMQPFLTEDFGNPASASHVYGWRAQAAVEKARESLAIHLGAADPREIVFTSGATESNNLALLGVLRPRLRRGRAHVLTVATEHSAVLDPCRALVAEGCSAALLPVAPDGLIDLAQLADAVTEDTALVSVMAANNEIGVLQPLAET
ncbi:MAG: aminotransferase class V-fold PLP-dependent enzyme, partial [Myxococcales bacterium]|nr:aminotransferase class V-fold PLP-dependent enzyme [Myxococcales bacterium]